MCGVKLKEGEDGGGQGGGPGSPMAAKGSPKRGAAGCTDRSARTGEASMWVGGGVPEVYCVGRRVDLVGYHGRRVRGRAEVELGYPRKRKEGLLVPRSLGL